MCRQRSLWYWRKLLQRSFLVPKLIVGRLISQIMKSSGRRRSRGVLMSSTITTVTNFLLLQHLHEPVPQQEEILMTHSIASDQHGGVGPLPLVKAGVVNDSLPGQSERLQRRRRNKRHMRIRPASSWSAENQSMNICKFHFLNWVTGEKRTFDVWF